MGKFMVMMIGFIRLIAIGVKSTNPPSFSSSSSSSQLHPNYLLPSPSFDEIIASTMYA